MRGGRLTLLQRYSWCILQPKPTGLEMICDLLANQEYSFLGESSIKIHAFRFRGEISDVHAEDQRIRKEISSAKASLSEKLSNIGRPHQPDTSFVCLSNTTKSDTIPLLTESFSCL